MSERSEQLTDDAISQLLRTRSVDPELGLLDDIVRAVGATPQDRPWLGLRPMRLAGKGNPDRRRLAARDDWSHRRRSGLLLPKPDLGVFEPVAGRIVYGSIFRRRDLGAYGSRGRHLGRSTQPLPIPQRRSSSPPSRVPLSGGRATAPGSSSKRATRTCSSCTPTVGDPGDRAAVGVQQIPGPTGATISPDGSRVVFAGLTPWRRTLVPRRGAVRRRR